MGISVGGWTLDRLDLILVLVYFVFYSEIGVHLLVNSKYHDSIGCKVCIRLYRTTRH